MIEQLIAEATECDFKVALEIKKPKSWLKSVSSFSNGIGGTLFFGISDDRKPIGLSDVQKDAEAISRLIKERITPLPQFILKPLQEDGKNLLALEVSPGRSTPYYYKADGVMVTIEDTIKGFKMILDGEVDYLPEQAFLNVGTIEEAIEKGKKLLEQAKK
jgi:predicted HTH transcriptional regulator